MVPRLSLVLLFVGLAVPAAAQQEPLKGVLNCAIFLMHRCDASGCRTRRPDTVEISIDFDRGTACIKRGGGRCRQPRSFALDRDKAGTRLLVFAQDSMLIRLARDWKIIGTEVQHDRTSTFFGRCGRG